MKYTGIYDDIIKLPHHVSKKYPQMSLEARSAQFAPFAALTGYDDQVKEVARLTNERKELADGLKIILDEKIQQIKRHISEKPQVTITYFVPDLKKQGGKYVTVTGNVEKIDEVKYSMILKNKKENSINEINKVTEISNENTKIKVTEIKINEIIEIEINVC